MRKSSGSRGSMCGCADVLMCLYGKCFELVILGFLKFNALKIKGKSQISHYHIIPSPYHLFIILLIIFTSTSCYEPREGCLDINATNFEVDADRACSNCCTYPVLKFAVSHKLTADSETNLNYNDSVYVDGAGNAFRVKNIQFYISNVRLMREDGTEVRPSGLVETTIVEANGDRRDTMIANDIALVNRSTFSDYNLGTFVTEGKFTQIKFDLGLQSLANQALPSSLPTGHPLRASGMYVNADTGYVFNRLEWFNSAAVSDTTTTLLKVATEQYRREVTLSIAGSGNVLEGFNVRIRLRINYLTWFENVNLKSDPPATLATKIMNNAANSFSVVAVELETQ